MIFGKNRIGWMQGRLVAPVRGRIQAFPHAQWEWEFEIGAARGFRIMEWIFERTRYRDNPLWSETGIRAIGALETRTGVKVDSVIGDYFMEHPFYRGSFMTRQRSLRVLDRLIDQCLKVKARFLEIPVVEVARFQNNKEKQDFALALGVRAQAALKRGLQITVESDLTPPEFKDLLCAPEMGAVGVCYDMGNSAAMGYSPRAEFVSYGKRVKNVHVKDRLRGGSSVSLGNGSVHFDQVFRGLKRVGYAGSFILQTARTAGKDLEVACDYRNWVANGLSRANKDHGSRPKR